MKKYNTEEERKAAIRESRKRWNKKHSEQVKEYKKRWYENNPDYFSEYYQKNKNKILEHNAEYSQRNKEEIAEYQSEYYHKNRETINKRLSEYYSTPKGRALSLVSKYKNADHKYNRGECTLTKEWILENVFSGQQCHYCEESDWKELGCDRKDSNLPHTPENCVPCCKKCNSKKGKKPYDEFLRLIGKID